MDKLEIKVLTAVRLAKLFIAGSRWVSKYADVLNDLNVYPVPDGDTGTNMSMTLQAVENDLIKLNQEMTMDGLIETVSESVLLGARGNSGTILSQIIQGFLSGIVGKTELNIKDVIHAFNKASEQAYKSHIASEHFQKYKQGTKHMIKTLVLSDQTPLNPQSQVNNFIQ